MAKAVPYGMTEALEQQLLNPNNRLDSFEDRFSDIVNFEWFQRETKHSRKENNSYENSNKMASYDLLVIDDFGLMNLNMNKCRDLFEIIESRDSRKATIIISQLPVAKRYQLFGDNIYFDACL